MVSFGMKYCWSAVSNIPENVMVLPAWTVEGSGSRIRVREVVWAKASGTIDDIDGGTKSMLTKNIPKNTERLFFLVAFYYG